MAPGGFHGVDTTLIKNVGSMFLGRYVLKSGSTGLHPMYESSRGLGGEMHKEIAHVVP